MTENYRAAQKVIEAIEQSNVSIEAVNIEADGNRWIVTVGGNANDRPNEDRLIPGTGNNEWEGDKGGDGDDVEPESIGGGTVMSVDPDDE